MAYSVLFLLCPFPVLYKRTLGGNGDLASEDVPIDSPTLIASFADGLPFELELYFGQWLGHDYVGLNAQIHLVLVQNPQPATTLAPLLAILGGF